MELDARLAVMAGLVLLVICLAVGFVRVAAAIRREHRTRFDRIQQQLERDATALVNRLIGRD